MKNFFHTVTTEIPLAVLAGLGHGKVPPFIEANNNDFIPRPVLTKNSHLSMAPVRDLPIGETIGEMTALSAERHSTLDDSSTSDEKSTEVEVMAVRQSLFTGLVLETSCQ